MEQPHQCPLHRHHPHIHSHHHHVHHHHSHHHHHHHHHHSHHHHHHHHSHNVCATHNYFSPNPTLHFCPHFIFPIQPTVHVPAGFAPPHISQESQNFQDGGVDVIEEVEDEDPIFVMTDEWREFFAKSEARRREAKKLAKKQRKT